MSKNGMWVLKFKDVDISNFSNGQNDGCFVFQCIVISLSSMDWDLTWCVHKRQNGLNVCWVHNAIHLSNMIQGFNLKQYGITTGTSFITSLCKLLFKKKLVCDDSFIWYMECIGLCVFTSSWYRQSIKIKAYMKFRQKRHSYIYNTTSLHIEIRLNYQYKTM